MPECQKIKKGGLDQYGAERFGRFIFATIRKKRGTETVNRLIIGMAAGSVDVRESMLLRDSELTLLDFRRLLKTHLFRCTNDLFNR